ncbi:MAG: DNA mismatch repair protein MutS [Nitrospirales bacterium]|nr:DNA mismatch repair protein MutS [Nitrospirales bacterium]
MSEPDLTPLFRQYQEIKQQHQEAIVFFRVGDFYEMFYEDAHKASAILNIALTSRDKTSPNPIPLCGVPHHAAMGYIAKLLHAGLTVALCEQVEDPKLAKGLVRREVVRLYTPGTLYDPELLHTNQSNFLAALSVSPPEETGPQRIGFSAVELSTGEFWIREFSGEQAREDFIDELIKVSPQELLHSLNLCQEFQALLSKLQLPRLAPVAPSWFDFDTSTQWFSQQFTPSQLHECGLDHVREGIEAGHAIFQYLRKTQPTTVHEHIQCPLVRRYGGEIPLDRMSIRNLELLEALAENEKDTTLLFVLDRTMTAMGSRLLRQWIVRPLANIDAIQERLNAVSEFIDTIQVRSSLQHLLKSIQDLERLSSRISLGSANPRELLALHQSLVGLSDISTLLSPLKAPLLVNLLKAWDPLSDVQTIIQNAVKSEAPISFRDGGIIQDGYDLQLDQLRHTATEGTTWIMDLETKERKQTGIDSLKIKYNQVFGYYIEVTKANLSRVPPEFMRKQTLANAERFTTEELKILEGNVLGATQQLRQLEETLFSQLRSLLAKSTPRIQAMAQCLATLDALLAFAEAAHVNRYVCPILHEGGVIDIREGRHPVIEQMSLEGGFIPNDTYLDLDTHRVLLITGPNMAGKSTYLRQIGLIVLMAQIGCFVPATSAKIGLVDRIFTRVGASDNLSKGQSTFMVEMTETARILQVATYRSLLLLDEVGRGTSTYDGLSIAWALAEYIQDRNVLGARTLFATHYHEMTELEHSRGGIKNLTISIKEDGENIIFLRKIIQGKADRSYGIHVAKLAGMPKPLLHRANEVLQQLENPHVPETLPEILLQDSAVQNLELPSPYPIIEEVKQMDLFNMSPLEALNRLADIQRRLDEK